jgi:elongation factor P
MIQATQLRRGNIVRMSGDLFRVVDFHHLTPGNWRAFVQSRLKNLRTGSIIEHRFRADDLVEKVALDKREMEYLYSDADAHYFMDTESFEQIQFTSDTLGDSMQYLVANSKIAVEFHEEAPVGIELPATVELTVVETEPGMPSATATNVLKPAKTETGLVVGVPHFISAGEKIRVDTSDGKYVARAG